MLDAFASLLCSKLCRHNWRKPSGHLIPSLIMGIGAVVADNLPCFTTSIPNQTESSVSLYCTC